METSADEVRKVKGAVPDVPVLAGPSVSKRNVAKLLRYADGAIVGTSLKTEGHTWNPVDDNRVKEFMKTVEKVR